MGNLFIVLTTKLGVRVRINFNNVLDYNRDNDGGTWIVYDAEHSIQVKESPEYIDQFTNPSDQMIGEPAEFVSKKMKFKNAPIGARFRFTDSNNVYIKIHSEGDGLVVKWNGCVEGHQSHCCWIDDETDFDTEIEVF